MTAKNKNDNDKDNEKERRQRLTPDELKAMIKDHFSSSAKFVYIFGSLAKNNGALMHAESDLDVAVYFNDECERNYKTCDNFQTSLLQKIDYERDVDLIDLRLSDIIITMQIIANGEVLFCNDPLLLVQYKALKQSEYIDFKRFRKPLEEKLIKSLRRP